MSVTIVGKAASPGYAIGKTLILEKEKSTEAAKSEDTREELEKLEKAIDICRSQLEEIKQKLEKETDSEKADIFSAQILILEDPMFVDEAKKIIMEKKLDVKSALIEVVKKAEDEFSQIEDEYIKERIQDVKDVAKRIVDICTGQRPSLALQGFRYILAAEELYPSQTAALNKDEVIGIATKRGGINSHAAIISRALRIPAVVGLSNLDLEIARDKVAVVDGKKGELIFNPSKDEEKKYRALMIDYNKKEEARIAFSNKVTVTKDGVRITLAVNVGNDKEYESIKRYNPEGVGLFRTEVYFLEREQMPTEEEQIDAYFKLLKAAQPQPVIIRLLDAGADKELKYIVQKKEDNPALGLRGIRLLLVKKNILNRQLKAVIKANNFGNARIMLPMVSIIEEIEEFRKIYNEVRDELKNDKESYNTDIPIGTMIETPSSALMADKFAKVSDFFSLGTNDLIQYTVAADRINEDISQVYQSLNPAVWRLIKTGADSANNAGIEISVCGEAASYPLCIPLFIGLGIKKLSVNPAALLGARENISKVDTSIARQAALKVLEFASAHEVEEYLKRIFPKLE